VIEAPVVAEVQVVIETPVVAKVAELAKPSEQEIDDEYQVFLALVKADKEAAKQAAKQAEKKRLLELEAKEDYERSVLREEAERVARAERGAANIAWVQVAKAEECRERATAQSANSKGCLQGDKPTDGLNKRQRHKLAKQIEEAKPSRTAEAPLIAPKPVLVSQVILSDEEEEQDDEVVPVVAKEQIVIEEKPVVKADEAAFTVVKTKATKAKESKTQTVVSEILMGLYKIEPEAPKEMALYKMCKSFGTTTACKHGDDCVFAHSYKQLERVECSHMNRCRFVCSLGKGAYNNRPCPDTGRFCKFWHQAESLVSYTARMGLPAPTAADIKAQSTQVAKPQAPKPQAPKAQSVQQAAKTQIVPRVEHFVESANTAAQPVQDKSEFGFTRFCKSAGTSTPCPHGDRCLYAHTYEQVQKQPCRFGDRCRYTVCVYEGFYKNKPCTTGDQICKFWHQDETPESYSVRLNLPAPELLVAKAPANKVSKPAPKAAAKPAVKPAPKAAAKRERAQAPAFERTKVTVQVSCSTKLAPWAKMTVVAQVSQQ
jgi:hypothetical protein